MMMKAVNSSRSLEAAAGTTADVIIIIIIAVIAADDIYRSGNTAVPYIMLDILAGFAL